MTCAKTNGIGSKAVMQDAAAIQGIESRYAALATLMDERMRRQWAAAEARSYGLGWRAGCEPGYGPVAEHDIQGIGGVGGA